jgi:hypothetical protein
MDNPHNLRVLAQALLAAADWMEDLKAEQEKIKGKDA